MDRSSVVWNRTASNFTNSNFWGQSTTTTVSVDVGQYTILNEARLFLNLTPTATGGAAAIKITRPCIAWINTCNTVIEYHGMPAGENYTSQSNRGDVGYILELLDLTYSGWEDSKDLETLAVPSAVALANNQPFEVAIPLRYLIDPCLTKKFLPIKTFTFSPNWRTLLECIAPGTGVTGFNVICNSLYISYPTAYMKLNPESPLKLPDLRGIYIYPLNRAVGDTQTSLTITPPGRPVYLYHAFLCSNTNALPGVASTGLYSFAPASTADQSYVNFQQVSLGGKTFPLNPQYNTTATGVGAGMLYHELQCISNNFTSGQDTFCTFAAFKTNYRIYAIDLSDNKSDAATFQFNAQYGALALPTGATTITHIIFVMYVPS
jgi:hypothetical protein